MVCIGNISEVKLRMEQLVEKNFPDQLSLPELVEASSEYERLLYVK